MNRGNFVASCGKFFFNLPQKNSVLAVSVAGVATVAGFFLSTYEKKKYRNTQENKFKSAATLATVATAPSGWLKICGKFLWQVATNLQQQLAVPSCR